jgi:hypothetical protein
MVLIIHKQMMTHLMLQSKMLFPIARQNEVKGQAVNSLTVMRGTRSMDLVVVGESPNRTRKSRLTTLTSDQVNEERGHPEVEGEVQEEGGGEEG